jgi:hypothetical protein
MLNAGRPSPLFRDLQLFEKLAGRAPTFAYVLKLAEQVLLTCLHGLQSGSMAGNRGQRPILFPRRILGEIKSGDHFLAAGLRGRKPFVKAGQSDLDRFAGKLGSPESQNLRAGIRQYKAQNPDRSVQYSAFRRTSQGSRDTSRKPASLFLDTFRPDDYPGMIARSVKATPICESTPKRSLDLDHSEIGLS